MDWELIFWAVGGILALLFFLVVLVVGPRCGDEVVRYEEPNPNIDRWEDEWD